MTAEQKQPRFDELLEAILNEIEQASDEELEEVIQLYTALLDTRYLTQEVSV